MTRELLDKYDKLKDLLHSYQSVAVAFSGGVDSTFLLFAAHEALEANAVAVTISSGLFPEREMEEARAFCEKLQVRHFVIETDELAIDGFAENPPNRCYICKKALFTDLRQLAAEQGIDEVAEGSNLDDNGDYRPGLQAVAELGIQSPLRRIGFTKQEIRDLSEHLGLPTWNKPSYACLASRIPYGDYIDKKKLRMAEQGEQLLLEMGFTGHRVRIHGNVARIELNPGQFDRFMTEKVRTEVYARFKEYGFAYVALDIKGYRTGSLNEALG